MRERNKGCGMVFLLIGSERTLAQRVDSYLVGFISNVILAERLPCQRGTIASGHPDAKWMLLLNYPAWAATRPIIYLDVGP